MEAAVSDRGHGSGSKPRWQATENMSRLFAQGGLGGEIQR